MTEDVGKYFGFPSLNNNREIGIEIEIEGAGLPVVNNIVWKTKADGSLRGESVEYLYKLPIPRKSVLNSLSYLIRKLKERGALLNSSDRCGVHVHINVRDLSFPSLINFIVLYIIFEDLLVKFCGKQREGNLFCLRFKDAEGVLFELIRAIEGGEWSDLGDNVRYASLNLAALGKFGSLEFRCMRTDDKDFTSIKTWVDILLKMKDAAQKFNHAEEIISAMSMAGPKMFLQQLFGQHSELLECKDMDELLMDGVRRAQLIAFAVPSKAKHAIIKDKALYKIGLGANRMWDNAQDRYNIQVEQDGRILDRLYVPGDDPDPEREGG